MERLPPHIMLRKTLRELPTKSGEGECVITELLVGFVCLQLRNCMQTELFQKPYLHAGSFRLVNSAPSSRRKAFENLIFC